MELLVKIDRVGALTAVSASNGETLQKIEVEFSCGQNHLLGAAFDREAVRLSGMTFNNTSIYVVDVTFGVSGTEKKFQNVRINRIMPF